MNILAWIKIGGAVAIVVVVVLHFRADAAMEANRDLWRSNAEAWERNARDWKASFEAAERVRSAEQTQAVTAVNEAQKSCDARVAEARRSAKAIKEIVHVEPKRDPAGCPVRSLVDPDQLRDALGAPAG